MKHLSYAILGVATLIGFTVSSSAQTTVFSDNFTGSSTVQSATPGAPTSTSADYEVFTSTAAPGAGNVINPNDFTLQSASGTSIFAEAMAQFTTTPVTLATIGDSITFNITFVDTANILITGNNVNSSLNIGLFNSGGTAPNQGELLGAGAPVLSGGSQTWQGYVSRLFLNGNASSYNRASQTGNGTTSQNQDLLFNNASSSATFNTPTGTTTTSTFGTSGNVAGLTQGNTYTMSYTLTLSAANTIRITNELFNGSSPTGSPILNNAGTSTGGAFLTNSFDSLAFGFRVNTAPSPAVTGTLDIGQITVIENLAAAPEPTTFALSALGGLALLATRRWRRQT